MCGGYALAEPTEVLEDVFSVDLVGENLPAPSWNIRPTNQVPIVVDTVDSEGDQRRRLESARWSLIPTWVKGEPPKFSTFNARREIQALPGACFGVLRMGCGRRGKDSALHSLRQTTCFCRVVFMVACTRERPLDAHGHHLDHAHRA